MDKAAYLDWQFGRNLPPNIRCVIYTTLDTCALFQLAHEIKGILYLSIQHNQLIRVHIE